MFVSCVPYFAPDFGSAAPHESISYFIFLCRVQRCGADMLIFQTCFLCTACPRVLTLPVRDRSPPPAAASSNEDDWVKADIDAETNSSVGNDWEKWD